MTGEWDRSLVGRYALYLGAAAAATILLWSHTHGLGTAAAIFAMLALALVAEAMPVQLPRMRGTVSVGFPIIHASALIFGPLAAAWIAAVGSLRKRELELKVAPGALIFNKLQLAGAALASSYVFRSTGGDLQAFNELPTVLAAVISGLAYLLINITAVTAYFVIKNHERPLAVWLTNIKWSFPNSLALLPISYLMASTYQLLGVLAPIFFILPLLVARYSFQRYIDMRGQYIATIRSLAAALEAKDPYTYGHADRVSQVSVGVGRQLGLSSEELERLQVAGILHDVGKIGIPDTILKKTGKFTEEEFREMTKHPEIGARIVENVNMLHDVADWIRYHHERVDGRGYPAGLTGEDIPLAARIISVADALDAMISHRPYKAAMTVAEALAEIRRCSGTQFDGSVVEALMTLAAQPGQLEQLLANEQGFAEHLLQALDPERVTASIRGQAEAAAAREPDAAQDAAAQAAGIAQEAGGTAVLKDDSPGDQGASPGSRAPSA